MLPMNFISAATGPSWVSLDNSDPGDPGEKAQSDGLRQKLDQQLTDVLLSQNLVVLTGLGTSRCVTEKHGTGCEKRAAPTMEDLWNEAKEKAGEKFAVVTDKVKYVCPPTG